MTYLPINRGLPVSFRSACCGTMHKLWSYALSTGFASPTLSAALTVVVETYYPGYIPCVPRNILLCAIHHIHRIYLPRGSLGFSFPGCEVVSMSVSLRPGGSATKCIIAFFRVLPTFICRSAFIPPVNW